MNDTIDREVEPQAGQSQRQRRPWSPPRVILSQLTNATAGTKTPFSHPEEHPGTSTISLVC